MPRITISYRRDDSGVITGRIFDRLAAHYGREAVFRDIDSIQPGTDFREQIDKVIDESDVVLAIVGPRWMGQRAGHNRLDDEDDPVRIEIETVLLKQVPLIPVLVLRAAMPRAAQLPDTLKEFAYRHAVQIDAGQDFDIHAGRLIRAVDRILEGNGSGSAEQVHRPPVHSESASPYDAGHLTAAPAEAASSENPLPVPVPAAAAERSDFAHAPVAIAPAPAAVGSAAPAEPYRPPATERWQFSRATLLGGGALGAAFALGAALYLKPTSEAPAMPPDMEVLSKEKVAAEAKVAALQAELAAARRQADQDQAKLSATLSGTEEKMTTTRKALETAQQQLTDRDKRMREMQSDTDKMTTDLREQKGIASSAQKQIDQLNTQLAALGDQQTRADAAEKALTAQKQAAARAQTRIDQLTAQLKPADDRQLPAEKLSADLAVERERYAQAQTEVDGLTKQVKTLHDQIATLQAAPSPSPAPMPVSPEAPVEQMREIQRALNTIGVYRGEASGSFDAGTQAAIKMFQSSLRAPETGVLSGEQMRMVLDVAREVSGALDQKPVSPQGVAANSVPGVDERCMRAWTFETGKGVGADQAEAAYWYALAAKDGEARAFTNLGMLIAHGWSNRNPDPATAIALWWAAAARGEAVAMFDLGVAYEHGIGVEADLGAAKTWFGRAAARNHADARVALKRLGG
jgi:TPR repeat protein